MRCKSCGHDVSMFDIDGGQCSKCRKLGSQEAIERHHRLSGMSADERDAEYRQLLARAQTEADFGAIPEHIVAEAIAGVVLTTAPSIPSHPDYEVIDVITAEAVLGMHIFKDIAASFRDVFGGRAASVQNTLRDARKLVLSDLKLEALRVHADAVIAIDLDYSEFKMNAGGGMLFVVASGTAIRFV